MGVGRTRWILVAVSILAVGALAAIGRSAGSPFADAPPAGEEEVQARVIEVIDEGVATQNGTEQPYQQLRLEMRLLAISLRDRNRFFTCCEIYWGV